MPVKTSRRKLPGWLWTQLIRLVGEQPEMDATRATLARLRTEIERERESGRGKIAAIEAELEKTREERLEWMAKASSTRKDLQDCQERSKELLEQVVQLTHKQRQARQSLLDQQFKTETTPLERNRFEMELAEARGRVQRAEARAKSAEGELARLRRADRQARQDAKRVKDLESRLAWAIQSGGAFQAALGASIEKVRELEEAVDRRPSLPGRRRRARRRYRKPGILTRANTPGS